MTRFGMLPCMARRGYSSELTDNEWTIIGALMAEEIGGRPVIHSLREILNAVFLHHPGQMHMAVVTA